MYIKNTIYVPFVFIATDEGKVIPENGIFCLIRLLSAGIKTYSFMNYHYP